MFTGVTAHKNSLGILCMICFFMLLWDGAMKVNIGKIFLEAIANI